MGRAASPALSHALLASGAVPGAADQATRALSDCARALTCLSRRRRFDLGTSRLLDDNSEEADAYCWDREHSRAERAPAPQDGAGSPRGSSSDGAGSPRFAESLASVPSSASAPLYDVPALPPHPGGGHVRGHFSADAIGGEGGGGAVPRAPAAFLYVVPASEGPGGSAGGDAAGHAAAGVPPLSPTRSMATGGAERGGGSAGVGLVLSALLSGGSRPPSR